MLAEGPADARSFAAPALPGPPPGAGLGYPAAPAPGTSPAAQPVGPPSQIPGTVPGPGLLSGDAQIHGRTLHVTLACRADGSASLSAPAIGPGVLAKGRYKCHKGRAALTLKVPAADAHRFSTPMIGTLSLGAQQFQITLANGPVSNTAWTDGGLQCNLFGPDTPYLVAPDFRVSPAAVIDVRPWVAFYTDASGWQWLGTAGVNKSNWYQWTATPTGISNWMTPAGALNPWTWAPISVHPGHHTYAVGVFEVEYLYFHPSYTWHYAPSQTATGQPTTYCSFP